MAQYTPTQVAQMVLNQGGTKAQAWVAAALVDGIESSGSTTAKNPKSTACGLFQFLTSTWISNGGGAYAPTACQASGEQQVTIFLKASAGGNFSPWAPDLGGSYNGQKITAPQAGSPVANKISTLSSQGLTALLGNVPTNWADAGAATATTGIGSLIPGGGSSAPAATCTVGFTFGVLGKVCLLSSSQVKALSGAAAILAGGVLLFYGVSMVAAVAGKSAGVSAPSLPSLPARAAPALPDDSSTAFAEGMAQGQSTNTDYQASRKSYLSDREKVRRTGAPVTKKKVPKIRTAAKGAELLAF